MEQLLLPQAVASEPHLTDSSADWECPLCGALFDYEVAGQPGSGYHDHEAQVAAACLQLAIDEHLQRHAEVDE